MTDPRGEASPRDNLGRYVPLACPDINCGGVLRYEGDGVWRCDGLVDPCHDDKELFAYTFTHYSGEAYEPV